MYIEVNGKRIEKITRFNYPAIVDYLIDCTTSDLDGMDFLDTVDGGSKKRNSFQGAIYALLNDLQAKNDCTIDALFDAINKDKTLSQANFQLFNTRGYYDHVSDLESRYYSEIEDFENQEYERFSAMIDEVIAQEEDPCIETSYDLDLARQRSAMKINEYLGQNWRENWKNYTKDMIDEVVLICRKTAETFDVDPEDILKDLPKIQDVKIRNNSVILYGAYFYRGDVKVLAFECRETAKTYKLPESKQKDRCFDYYMTLKKEEQSEYIAFSDEEARQKLNQRRKK